MKAGEWLGPWVLCHTLEAVMKKMEPGSLHVHVHVVSQPGGAVPVLYTARSSLHRQTMSCMSRKQHVASDTLALCASRAADLLASCILLKQVFVNPCQHSIARGIA